MAKDFFWASFYGIVGGTNGYFAIENLLDAASTKVAVMQAHLASAPELTDQVYQAAHDAADAAASGDFFRGFFYAGVAGLMGALVIYYATGKED